MTGLIKYLFIVFIIIIAMSVLPMIAAVYDKPYTYNTVGKTENPQSVGIHTIYTEKDRKCVGACQVIMTGVALEVLGVNVSGTVRSIGKKVLDIIL